ARAAAPAQRRPAGPDLVRGFSRARLAAFGEALLAEGQRGSYPGCVAAISRNGEIIHLEAYGHMDAARTKPMTRDAIFLQASMTKPVTSVAAMMLVEQGKMKLSDPVAMFLPELANVKVETRRDGQPAEEVAPRRPMTVQDLLRHSSGFVYPDSAPSTRIREMYTEGNITASAGPITGDEMLRRLGAIPLAHHPGTMFHYSISTDVLGLVVERVSGQRLDRFFVERITGPLGMRDTTWFVEPARRARIAEALDSDPLKAGMWRSYRILEDEAGRSYFKGGAGLVSTAPDYIRFATMLANGGVFDGRRYLSAPIVNFMMSNHIQGMGGSPEASTGPGYGFGLGFGVRLQDGFAVAPGSTGDAMWAGAWGTSFTVDRAEGLAAVFMAQGPSRRGQTRMLFKNLVYGAMLESQRR
ncbi:serine hydrolase domain-containing protein, partial [Roseomonas rosulenta]|uniref:serine hydrolase domain-containing protein n=1 Tax=Roseomonas rosulenta TaxID=2748667 RepID=UPI0018E02250